MKTGLRYIYRHLLIILSVACLFTSGCGLALSSDQSSVSTLNSADPAISISDSEEVPSYSGEPYAVINDNLPLFTDDDMTCEAFETYSELDELGRCGTAFACIGQELMPTEEREDISEVKPTGWHSIRYDFIDGESLYNRCHLIAYELTAENANEENLITGTRYFNVEGMLPFENEVASYIRSTGNHVLYRVTPVFDGDNLLADGVLMEAESVEDDGEGVLFCVFCYNVQPDVIIDYATGDAERTDAEDDGPQTYILNTNTMRFHLPDCDSVSDMSEKNKKEYTGMRQSLIDEGYTPCGNCCP